MIFADIDERAAGWICVALADLKRRGPDGLRPPPGVDEFMRWCQSRAKRGQTGQVVADLAQLVEAESVDGLLLRYDEAGHVLNVSRSVLKRLIAAGEIPTVRVAGGVRIRRTDLQAYVDSLASIDRTGGTAA